MAHAPPLDGDREASSWYHQEQSPDAVYHTRRPCYVRLSMHSRSWVTILCRSHRRYGIGGFGPATQVGIGCHESIHDTRQGQMGDRLPAKQARGLVIRHGTLEMHLERIGQAHGGAPWDAGAQPGIGEQLADDAHRRRHDGDTACQGLDYRQTFGLMPGGQREQMRSSQQG